MTKRLCRRKPKRSKQAIKKIDGVVDTNAGVVVSGPAVTFKVDPQLAAKFGVTRGGYCSRG